MFPHVRKSHAYAGLEARAFYSVSSPICSRLLVVRAAPWGGARLLLGTRAATLVQAGPFLGFRWLALLSGDGTYTGARTKKLQAS